MYKQQLYERFLEQHPINSEFIDLFLTGTLNSHDSMLCFNSDAEEA